MADFIFVRKSRNIASSAVHIFLNLLLGIGSVMITVLSGSPLIGLILVLVSKWRIFAVRPRYIWTNLKANLVDIIVGASTVLLTYSLSNTSLLPVTFILAGFYCIWLIFIKPLTSEAANLVQSLIAVFLGISATTFLTADHNSILIVTLAFLIGYAASRHVLIQSNDQEHTLSTFICGLVFAEIAWLCHFWIIIYTYGTTGIRVPQLAIILTLFAFIYNSARQAVIKHQDDFKFKDILAPVIYGSILIIIIILWFSDPFFNL